MTDYGGAPTRDLPDGRVLVLYPLIMGTVRLCIGHQDSSTYDDAWCYQTPAEGLAAMAEWDGEGDPPDGWFRHIGTGRRRPDGDPTREYIAR